MKEALNITEKKLGEGAGERNYTTQMDAARQGIITPEMKAVAAKEYRTEEEIRDLVAKLSLIHI